MDEFEFVKIKEQLSKEISVTRSKISKYTELSKPIAPENSIGRVSRMDAINNKSIVFTTFYKKCNFLNTF